jgi:hypothetical protein
MEVAFANAHDLRLRLKTTERRRVDDSRAVTLVLVAVVINARRIRRQPPLSELWIDRIA